MLPLILKVIADTKDAKFTPVTREMDGLRMSSQKTGQAVRQLANIFSDSRDPVVALAGSVDGLTRAFRLGLGATVAVVGITEAIKVFVSNSEKMNAVTEMVNASIKDFQSSVGLVNFEGATGQVVKLTNALQKAREGMPTSGGGGFLDEILSRVGGSIANIGLSKEKAQLAISEAQTALQQAKYAAETAISKENELSALRLINAEEAKRVEIQQKYDKEIESARRQGILTPGLEQGLGTRRDIALSALDAPAQQQAKEQRMQSYQAALSGAGAPPISAPQSPSAGIFSGIVDEVRVIKQYVATMTDLMDKRLGVPILRSAS